MNIKKNIFKNKNFKLGYYFQVLMHACIPAVLLRAAKEKYLNNVSVQEDRHIQERVAYYNKLTDPIPIKNDPNVVKLSTLSKPKKSRIYYYDIKKYLRYFDRELPFLYKLGDNIDIFSKPHIVKSRPINGSKNEVVLKLNSIRHFNFIKDDRLFHEKENLLFGRLAVYQDIRKRFFEQYFNHQLCDLGDVGKRKESRWLKPKVDIAYHLKYKFILALEGNDVATNLKWIMSSNSIAVMPKPRYETWFMEGRLIPDVHYICIKDDFSDVVDKLQYYIEHPQEAEAISKQANLWVEQFKNHKREHIINLMVMEKYFKLTV
jgi:hypothetical protein